MGPAACAHLHGRGLVEAAHLLSRAPGGSDAALGLVLDAGVRLVAPTGTCLTRARELMSNYHDTPMDHAAPIPEK